MFNLFRSRDKVVRFVLGALLVLVSLSMLTYLIPSYNTGSGPTDIIVAEIGKEKITLPEVQQKIQSVMRGRQVPQEMLPFFAPQVVESMINEYALAYQAQRMGFEVKQTDIADAIRQLIPSLFQDGKFVGTDAYSMVLAQQNMTISQFEGDLARQLLITRLRNIVLEGTVVSPREVEDAFRKRNEKVQVEYVKVSADKYRAEVQVTPEELRSYYEAGKNSFRIPDKRSLGILVADQAKLEQSIQPTDAELQALYKQNRDKYRTPERVKVRHILLTTTGKTPEQDKAIKAKAEDLLKQIKAGGNFAELAKKNSEDPGSAQNGGELPDWVVRGQTVPEFEKVAFSMKPGDTSELVKTQYGYHIIQVLKHEDARLRPFDEVKNEIASDYKKQKVNDKMQSLSDQMAAELKKDPLHHEKVAAALGVQLVKVDKVAPGDPLPEIGVNKDFDASLADLKAGDVSQPVVLPANKLAVASILAVFPAHPATFEEALPQIRAGMTQQKLNQLVSKKADELLAKAKSMNGDLKKAAQSMGLELKSSSAVSRDGAVEGLGAASYITQAFSLPAGSLFGPIAVDQARAVVKVVSRVDANMAELAAQRQDLTEELKSQKAREREQLFEAGLRDALVREGKIKIHQDVIARLTSNARG